MTAGPGATRRGPALARAASGGAAHLRALGAAPRPAGGTAEAAARAYAAEVLRRAGYAVHEVPFRYSDVPGRYGTPAAGVWAGLTLAAAAAAGRAGRPRAALAVVAGGGAALGAAGLWAARAGVRGMPLGVRRGVNLVAVPRGTPAPADGGPPGAGLGVWLVAHLDSKSQPVPMAARVGGVVGTLAAAAAVAAVATAELATGRGVVARRGWTALGALGVAAAAPVALTTVGEGSDGALDNASGVAAVLDAAVVLARGGARVGVLLTSAEELGLAGAHAWAASWAAAGRAPAVALNCDGVDDAGPVVVLRGARVGSRVRRALAAVPAARARRIPPGLLVDGVALAAAGWDAVTVSKGTYGTLRRVHTARDSLANLRGDGVAAAARVLVALARTLLAAARGPGRPD